MAAVDEWCKLRNKGKEAFIIIDEVQELENWDEIIASLYEDHTIKAKIIITGLNSKLLASEVTTKLSGRFYSLEVFPFSFEEFSKIRKKDPKILESFTEFLNAATTPEASIVAHEPTRANLIEGIINTTVQKDIIERYNPSSPALLAKMVEFTRLNSSQKFSLKNIKGTLNNQVRKHDQIGATKVENYFTYLKTVYFCHECPSFSHRKKDVLNRSNNKYYLNDWGMALFTQHFEPGRILENVIFMELLKKGYDVKTYYSYNNANLEVDFWAHKKNRDLFIQVAWSLGDPAENPALHNREYGNLIHVKDQGEKFLVSMDPQRSRDGIIAIQPHDFILQL